MGRLPRDAKTPSSLGEGQPLLVDEAPSLLAARSDLAVQLALVSNLVAHGAAAHHPSRHDDYRFTRTTSTRSRGAAIRYSLSLAR